MGKFQNEKVNTTLYSREEGKRFFFPIPGNGKLNTNEMQTPSPKSLNIKKGCGCDSCGITLPTLPTDGEALGAGAAPHCQEPVFL